MWLGSMGCCKIMRLRDRRFVYEAVLRKLLGIF